jgi:hypothetical protein
MADAFAFLALQYPQQGGLTGQRFNAFELAERVRRDGWDWPWRATSLAESQSATQRVPGLSPQS